MVWHTAWNYLVYPSATDAFGDEWLAKAATKIIGEIDIVPNAIGSLCPHSAHAATHYSSQALGGFIC